MIDVDPGAIAPASSKWQCLSAHENGNGYIYTGTRAQFIAAGLVLAGEFPGDPGNRAKHARSWRNAGPGQRVRMWRQRDGTFVVVVNFTDVEQRAFDAREGRIVDLLLARHAAENKAAAARRTQGHARYLTTSAGIACHRDLARWQFMQAVEFMWNLRGSPDFPYTFDQDVTDQVREHVVAINRLYAGAEMRVSHLGIAGRDLQFQAFFRLLAGSISQAKDGNGDGV
jgi:hypothetical protein